MCSGRVHQDLLTASPQRVMTTTAVTDQDRRTPCICDVLATQDGRLLMADIVNKMIKVMSLSDQTSVTSVKLDEAPRCFAALSDGLVALTADNNTLFLLDVSGQVAVTSRIKTVREYEGVADGPDDDTLIVSCSKDGDGPAIIDVITKHGGLVRTVVDGNTLTGLERPTKICIMDGHVMIPDLHQDCVYRVEVTTGRLVDTLTHPQLNTPWQVVGDEHGNTYVTSVFDRCVLVLTASGQFRKLLHARQHIDKDYVYPVSLCLTRSGIVVVWANDDFSACVVIGYDLV